MNLSMKLRQRKRTTTPAAPAPPQPLFSRQTKKKKLKTTPDFLVKCTRIVSRCNGYLIGFVVACALFTFVSLLTAEYLRPDCESYNGRRCNDRGVCNSYGICECDSLYSGSACESTLVPGYLAITNEECNGNGFANPFIRILDSCAEKIVNYAKSDDGWASPECVNDINEKRIRVNEFTKQGLSTEEAQYIPACICKPGRTGVDCMESACPVDEDGYACGGDGRRNTTVGLFFNGTNAGFGCQCKRPTSLNLPQFANVFSDEAQTEIALKYRDFFDSPLCGTIISPANNTVFLYNQPDDYKCYCEQDWKGKACTEGKCPSSPGTNVVCNGRGHPSFGFGRVLNTTRTISTSKRPCQVRCSDGHSRCQTGKLQNTQCINTAFSSLGVSPLFVESRACQAGPVCPAATPLRCPQGTCSAFPSSNVGNLCISGYKTGVIDPARMSSVARVYRCGDFTTRASITACFANTTTIDSIVGFDSESREGGLVFNSSGSLELDLGSPLVHFEIVTDATAGALVMKSHTGVEIRSTPDATSIRNVFSGGFSLTPSDLAASKFTQASGTVFISNANTTADDDANTQFWVYPMPFNHSSAGAIPSEYSVVRLISGSNAYIMDAVDADILVGQKTVYTDFDPAAPLLVVAEAGAVESWFYPSGPSKVISRVGCLSAPTKCAWYWDQDNAQVRNLDSTAWICPDGDVLESQDTPCASNLTTWDDGLFGYFFGFSTRLRVRSRLVLPHDTTDTEFELWYQNPDQDSYPFTLSFEGTDQTPIVRSVLFLTSSRLEFPCTCAPNTLYRNRTTLHTEWWAQSNSRKVEENSLEVNQLVLAADTSTGEPVLVRAKVVEVNALTNVAQLSPLKNYSASGNFGSFFQNIRAITTSEALSGLDDCDSKVAPFRCPDGTCSGAAFSTREVDATCNCTMSVGTTAEVSHVCSCSDATEEANIPCKCSGGGCDCSDSVSPVFESRLWNKLTEAFPEACGCMLAANMSVLDFATPVVTASSVQGEYEAENALVGVDGSWRSNTTDLVFPVWLQYEFVHKHLVTAVEVRFAYTSGEDDDAHVPTLVYFQASNDDDTWVTLQNFTSSADSGNSTIFKNVNTTGDTYRFFRLLAPMSFMGVKSWDIYTDHLCTCEMDLDTMAVDFSAVSSLTAFRTVEFWEADIAFHNASLGTNQDCVCVDSCTLAAYPGLTVNSSADGVCSDDKYVATKITPSLVTTTSAPTNFTMNATTFSEEALDVTLYTSLDDMDDDVVAAVQWATNETGLLNETQLTEFYSTWSTALFDWQTRPGLYFTDLPEFADTIVYYLTASGYIPLSTAAYPGVTLVFDAFTETFTKTTITITGDLVSNGLACAAGRDCTDCGPSTRAQDVLAGYGCSLNTTATAFQLALDSIPAPATALYIPNVSAVVGVTAVIKGIELTHTATVATLTDCFGQVCSNASLPHQCPDGSCVRWAKDCSTRFDCPGNGCVQNLDASEEDYDVYRCACEVGYAGDGCQYHNTRPAQPEVRDPFAPSEVATCGGPPHLREKPPIVNIGDANNDLRTADIEQLNLRVTGNSVPKSPLDIDNHRVMPNAGPFGRVLQRVVVLADQSGLVESTYRRIYTTCPFARKDKHGRYTLLTDDVISRDPITGEVLEWADPDFTWPNGYTSYDDFPYRCPNGQCVQNENYCERSAILYPICNGRGTCMADGTCECNPGWKTFMISEEFSKSMRYPYEFDYNEDNTDPTAWKVNMNWRSQGMNWCSARDCSAVSCEIPYKCDPGTPELDFKDAQVYCPTGTFHAGKCATSYRKCNANDGLGISNPIACSGKGIPRTKDFTGEQYCACGDVVNELADITNTVSITHLKKNGWGGEYCDQYYARRGRIAWSEWDYVNNKAWTSSVTKQSLPGKWVSEVGVPVGPDPKDLVLWDQCCDSSVYPRLELCPFVPCESGGTVNCKLATDCITPDSPKVYACNNRGTPLADGTCHCQRDETAGSGYTHDLSQFSEKGCFKLVECAQGPISASPCNYMPGCGTNTDEWRHPMPFESFWEQQFPSMLGLQGEPTNTTKALRANLHQSDAKTVVSSALESIAQDVTDALAGLSGCICVYPNNSQEFMLDVGANLKYNQSFNAPYLIPANTYDTFWDPLPVLTDSDLFSQLSNTSDVNIHVVPGDWIRYVPVDDSQTFTLASINLYAGTATEGTSVGFYKLSDDTQVCDVMAIDTTFDGLSWHGTGTTVCGPTYTNFNFVAESDYAAECGSAPTSYSCVKWREATCLAQASAVYWGFEETLVTYPGCTRDCGSVKANCVCCVKVTDGFTMDDQGLYMLVISGEIYLGEWRVYGYGQERTLPIPDGLEKIITRKVGKNIGCTDDLFMDDAVGTSGNYYTPREDNGAVQVPRTRREAIERCEATGGFLAVPDHSEDPPYMFGLQRACAAGDLQGACWVAGQDTEVKRELLTSDYFVDPECKLKGCFEMNNVTGVPVFSARQYDGDHYLYTEPVVVNQIEDPLSTTEFYNNFTKEGMKRTIQNEYFNADGEIPKWDIIDVFNEGGDDRFSRNYGLFLYDVVNGYKWLDNEKEQKPMVYSHNVGSCLIYFYGKCRGPIWNLPTGLLSEPSRICFDGDVVVTHKLFITLDKTRDTNTRSSIQYPPIQTYFMWGSPINFEEIFLKSQFGTQFEFRGMSSCWSSDSIYCVDNQYTKPCAFVEASTDTTTRGQRPAQAATKTFVSGIGRPQSATFKDYYDPRTLMTYDRVEAIPGLQLSGLTDFPVTEWKAIRFFPFTSLPVTDGLAQKNTVLSQIFLSFSTPVSGGTVGHNFVNSKAAYRYLPVFFNATVHHQIDLRASGTPLGALVHTIDDPVYFTKSFTRLSTVVATNDATRFNVPTAWSVPTVSVFSGIFTEAEIPLCYTCLATLPRNFEFDQKAYTVRPYGGQFYPPVEPDIVLRNNRTGVWESLTSLRQAKTLARYVHAISYVLYTPLDTPAWFDDGSDPTTGAVSTLWDTNTCVTVDADSFGLRGNSNGFSLSACRSEVKLNFVCQLDTVKYTTKRGHQCDKCGSGSRLVTYTEDGGSCYRDFPLANATAYPFFHQIKEAVDLGLADSVADSYNLAPATIDFGNSSVVWAFPRAVELWTKRYCDWSGFQSRGASPALNWVCMALDKIYPRDCGLLTDPITGLQDRYCAANREMCSLQSEIKPYTPIGVDKAPQFLKHVESDALAYTDTTCGPVVPLRSYFEIDKHGFAQDDLLNNFVLLSLTDASVRLVYSASQSSEAPQVYNAGKNPSSYIFQLGVQAAIAGLYSARCSGCGVVTMGVFVHTLQPTTYDPNPDTRVYALENVTLDLTGTKSSYLVHINVTEDDTGAVVEVGSLSFPANVYKGVGFTFWGVDSSLELELFNPLITDAESRNRCVTRNTTVWYNPQGRIKSTVPLNQCIITDEQLDEHPEHSLGECACALPYAGATCECPGITSKFGHEVCGGYGDADAAVLSPDDGVTLLRTRAGSEAGCFAFEGFFVEGARRTLTECKCIDFGRVYYTTMVPEAAFSSVTVTVESAPERGTLVFWENSNPDGLWLFKDEIELDCQETAQQLPYFSTAAEIQEMIKTFQGMPVFTDLRVQSGNFSEWKFDNSQVSFLTNSTGGTALTLGGARVPINCTYYVEECAVMNFNNLAYKSVLNSTYGETVFTDGMTDIADTTYLSTLISWPARSKITSVVIYVFWTGVTPTTSIFTFVGGVTNVECTSFGVSDGSPLECSAVVPWYQFNITSGGGTTIREVQVFEQDDLSRFTGYN